MLPLSCQSSTLWLSLNLIFLHILHIQGLSSSADDVTHLHGLLKQSEELLQSESTRLAPFLAELDPSKHSLGYLYILEACTAAPNAKEQANELVLSIARFLNDCAAEQIRLAPDKFVSVCKRFKDQVMLLETPMRGVAPLLTAIRKLQPSSEHLTSLHPDFLLLCLLAKCYKTGQKRYRKALELLHNVVTAPMSTINAIAVEAYKKYILISLIHLGQPYIELVTCYVNGKISELEAYVQANREIFEIVSLLYLTFSLLLSEALDLPNRFGLETRTRLRVRIRLSLERAKEDVKSLEVLNKKQDEFGDLKSWMHKNGLPPCKVVLKERTSHDSKHSPIHYVAASEDLQAGDVAFSVPNSLVVTLERVLGNENIGKKSFWYPYIKELDRQRGRGQQAVESPILWTETELAYLTGSPTKDEVLERAEGIKREYNELDTVWFMAGSLFQQYPYDIPTEAFPFEIFKQAFVAVQSCVVHLQKVSLARRFALVPLGPPLLAYKSNCRAMLTAVDGAVQLVVDRPYKAGESIVVCEVKADSYFRCGPQPIQNSKLLLNYGFVDEDNAYDRIVVEAALNTEDPQYQDKRMVAQRNGKLSVQVFHVSVGKEKEAVADMLPYLQLGYVSDPSEMQSVISSQGPICPVSPCMERAVLDQLAGYFNTRLAGYATTLSEDDSLLADIDLDPKKRVATQLVRLEKKMLSACLRATVDLIKQLPDSTVSPCPAPYAPKLR
ncbi:rubisco methyltransferase family protein [Actinidia rufa]|uniref:Rubisco methyltransferase family protein n=1 Tax=Actinidia rufa TaxID=165716 RepID=A0A7J0H825_9ERIC|nr:rubisco methyltransferase family protein [Actinidia rufa]